MISDDGASQANSDRVTFPPWTSPSSDLEGWEPPSLKR
jgi:hypothetical protein